MTKSDVGRGRPPKYSRFKPGISGNPKGRPKRRVTALGEITNDVFTAFVGYRDDGRLRKATRHELSVRALVKHALNGEISAAEMLLKLRSKAQAGDVSVQRIAVSNWLPDYPGQTGEQKSCQHRNEADLELPGEREQPGTAPPFNKPQQTTLGSTNETDFERNPTDLTGHA
jgi:Family of unknown function (DUF5681)